MMPYADRRRVWLHGGSAAAATAVVVAALLLNAVTLLPATHEHGPLHDSQACSICQLQATGVWTTSPPPVLPALQSLPWSSPPTEYLPRAQWTDPGTPSRGPPDCA